jgi:hypothetical protein
MTEFSFTKVGDSWSVRVWNGPTTNLAGQTVVVKTKAGAEKQVKLGEIVQTNGRAQVYAIAPDSPKEDTEPDPTLPGADVVPVGRYAIPMSMFAEETNWLFVRVWRASRNQKIVKTYLIKALDGELEKGSEVDTKATLAMIVAFGPAKAAQEFGWRTGFCGRCGDRLKNNLSRKLGTGPVCMKKLWSDKDRLRLTREAREELRRAGLDPDGKYDSLEAA